MPLYNQYFDESYNMQLIKFSIIPHRFYYTMYIIITAMIVYGFSQSVGRIVINSPYPNPPILYIHMTVATCWLILTLVQAFLIQNRQVYLHRLVGICSLPLGFIIPIIGVPLTIIMTRLHMQEGYVVDDREMIFPISDVVHFIFLYWLAIWWRRRPEIHKRLMLMTAITFTRAAFFRYPVSMYQEVWVLFGMDFLILIAAGRDLLVERRVNKVYLIGFPIMAAVQLLEHSVSCSHWWKIIADEIVS